MRKISDTMARLAALRAQYGSQAAGPSGPDNLQVLTGFGSNPGALKAKIHIPDDLPKGAALVVVLHGCTQDASAYDRHSGWSRLAEEAGFALLLPEQQRANNPNLCFNWFQPADAGRDSGEALSIRQMVETMVKTHGLDRERIFVTGLSAGGAMAAAMLASYPEVFAGGAIIAGLAYASATTVPEAFDRMRGHGGPSQEDLQRALRDASDHRGPWPRISIWHGSVDHTVAPSSAQAIADQWRQVHKANQAPTYSKTEGIRSKQVWSDTAGEPLIEINMIAGMGHGTPLGDGLGTPGPFMLDVGVSSTREIARFWGIAAADRRAATKARQAAPGRDRPLPHLRVPDVDRAGANTAEPSGGRPSQRNGGSGATGVKKIIEDALRAAGLMR